MTKDGRCAWCRKILPQTTGKGRPRTFCSQRCRQWAWVARQRADELQLSEGELIIAKTTLDELHDGLYVLACAVEDAERDLEAAGPKAPAAELRRILDWLLEGARPLRNREISPDPGPPTARP